LAIVAALIGAALGIGVGIFLGGLTTGALSDYGVVFVLPYRSLVVFVVRCAAALSKGRPEGSEPASNYLDEILVHPAIFGLRPQNRTPEQAFERLGSPPALRLLTLERMSGL
jgi:hypothetical protein